MKIIDIKLVTDYVMGNDIKGYDIDLLEDNCEFMKAVITYTNDKKMYSFCSQRVKNDYNFVKFLIDKFNKELDFIIEVADNYLKNSDDEINKTELEIIMNNLLKNSKDMKLVKYGLSADIRYITHRVNFELIKSEYDEETIDLLQSGFVLLIDNFSYSDVIMNYYATRYINDILRDLNIDLETLLHKNFKDYESLNNYGVNRFMIEFINQYDTFLSEYVFCHIDILNKLLGNLNKIQKRWEIFEKQYESRRYEKLFDKIDQYLMENSQDFFLDEFQAIYYASNVLGISNEIIKYAGISDEHLYYLKEFFKLSKNLKVKDLLHLKNIENIIIECLELETTNYKKDSNFQSKFSNRDSDTGIILNINEIMKERKSSKL